MPHLSVKPYAASHSVNSNQANSVNSNQPEFDKTAPYGSKDYFGTSAQSDMEGVNKEIDNLLSRVKFNDRPFALIDFVAEKNPERLVEVMKTIRDKGITLIASKVVETVAKHAPWQVCNVLQCLDLGNVGIPEITFIVQHIAQHSPKELFSAVKSLDFKKLGDARYFLILTLVDIKNADFTPKIFGDVLDAMDVNSMTAAQKSDLIGSVAYQETTILSTNRPKSNKEIPSAKQSYFTALVQKIDLMKINGLDFHTVSSRLKSSLEYYPLKTQAQMNRIWQGKE